MDGRVVAIGADHGGVSLKSSLVSWLSDAGYPVLDLGTDGPVPVDYPDYAEAVAGALRQGEADVGIAVCGSGIGMSIALVARLYPSVIHCTVGMSAVQCSEIRGSAMLIPDWSVTDRNIPIATAPYAHHL